MFQQGEIVSNKYRIVARLGSGAFSEVYLVEQINLKIFRALKCINKRYDSYGFAIKEADILKNLRHPAIPIIYDIEENDDSVCIIEEFIEGMSLNSFISNNSHIPLQEKLEIVLQLCNVVEHLHANGIYHADIKPENILYNNGKIFLLDYGNAGTIGENKNLCIGTKGFAAPELYVSERIREGSDVYSIGVIMLMLTTGRKELNAINEVNPKSLRQLIKDCLLHSQAERLNSVDELVTRINKIKKIKADSKNVSLSICFAGAYSHSGTTHCALLAGFYLKKSGFNPILCERNNSNDYIKLLRHKDCVRFHDGIYEADGLKMVPWYSGCVNMENQLNATRIIYDIGKLDDDNISFAKSCDVVCLVTGGKPYELDIASQLLRRNDFSKIYTLINLIGVKDYKRIIKTISVTNPVRVGYFPDVTKVGAGRLKFDRKKN